MILATITAAYAAAYSPPTQSVVRRPRVAPAMADQGYDVGRFAGRYALGKNLPAVLKKDHFTFDRAGSGEVRVLGGACSEALGGANLAALLEDGFALEQRAMEDLRNERPAECMSVHTSAGVP